jgi:hypothetical protein
MPLNKGACNNFAKVFAFASLFQPFGPFKRQDASGDNVRAACPFTHNDRKIFPLGPQDDSF